jgi:hippurate hydrolase
VRDQIVAAIKRTADGVAVGYGVPQDRMPIVTVSKTEFTPVTYNDPALAERMRGDAVASLGGDHVLPASSVMGSEDVGSFALDGKIPAVMFNLGAADQEKLAHAKETGMPLPSLHSALFAPVYGPTITTGVTAMTAMALDLLK